MCNTYTLTVHLSPWWPQHRAGLRLIALQFASYDAVLLISPTLFPLVVSSSSSSSSSPYYYYYYYYHYFSTLQTALQFMCIGLLPPRLPVLAHFLSKRRKWAFLEIRMRERERERETVCVYSLKFWSSWFYFTKVR